MTTMIQNIALGCIVLLMNANMILAEWSPPPVQLPEKISHPLIACTPDELVRLKAAFQGTGADHDLIADIISKADLAMKKPISYPPRGGQHNQWYQCDICQIALKTIDNTHHQCPKCQKIYTGEPYDDVIFSKQHSANLNAARDAAWAYVITDEKRYAQFSAEILLGYAKRYNDYPYHSNTRVGGEPNKTGGHLFEQTLNEAATMTTQIALAYDLIYNTLSADDRKQIEDQLIRPILTNIDKHRAGKNNWQTWHNAAFITGGAVIGDIGWVKRAIQDPDNGFLHQMKVSVSPEGMWYENSWGYHFYTLHAMMGITETARRIGIDLWNHPAMRSMYTLPVRYTMPDGSLPRWGDDVNSSVLTQPELMAAAAHAYQDPSLAALVAKPTLQSILLGVNPVNNPNTAIEGSEIFASAGHAILRTNGDAKLAAAITYGPFGGFHGHFDKLSFVFYGLGQELGVDPGRAASQAYRLPIHKDWYRATIGHNAVVVDGESQEGAEGKLIGFAATPTHAAAFVGCDTAYAGVQQKRLLLLTPDYLLVVDRLNADTDRRFDWVYHQRSDSVTSTDATESGKLPSNYAGAEFLQNIKQGLSDKSVAVDFTSSSHGVRLTFDAQPKTEIGVANGVGKSVNDRIPMTMLTRTGKQAWFAAIIEPTIAGKPPTMTEITLKPTATGALIEITRGNAKEQLEITADTFKLLSGEKTLLQSPGK